MRLVDPATDAFLIGAGFSQETGLPLGGELTEIIRKGLSPTVMDRLTKHHNKNDPAHALDAAGRAIFQAILQDPNLSYEEMVDALVRPHVHKLRFKGYDGDEYARWILWAAGATLSDMTLKTKPALGISALLYEGLVPLTHAKKRLDVYSLNHDLVLEALCEAFAVDVDCGLAGGEARFYSHDRRHQAIFDRADRLDGNIPLQFSHKGAGINLLKMHGSLDQFGWGDHGNNTTRSLVKLRRRADLDVIEHYRTLIEQVNYSLDGKDPFLLMHERAVVGEDGEMEFLRNTPLAGTDKFGPGYPGYPLPEALEAMRERLAVKDHLYVIGCSLNDAHLAKIIQEWDATGSRTLYMVRPNAVPTTRPPFPFHGRVEPISMDATRFLSESAGVQFTAAQVRLHALVHQARAKVRAANLAPRQSSSL